VTRYSKALLEEDADLENDLGIDSVKRLEILIALGKKVDVNLVNSEQDGSIRTIGQIINWVKVKSDQRRGTVKQTGSSELALLVFDSNGSRFAATPRMDVLANLTNRKTQQTPFLN
jgi:acyl carrier protein